MTTVTKIIFECESLPYSTNFTQHYTVHCDVSYTNKLMAVSPEHVMRLLKANIERDSQQVFDLLIALKLLLEDPHNDKMLGLLRRCVDTCVPQDIDFSKYAEHLETKLKGLYAQD